VRERRAKSESGKQSAVDMIKENTILTIDVGGACLKMAEFSIGPNGDNITLERYAVKELSTELAENNFAAAFAVAFNDLMRENDFVSHQVRVSISSLYAFQRLSKLPPLLGNRSRTAQVVEGEAKLTVPYPLEEVLWDYQLIKHTKVFEIESEEGSESGEVLTDTVEELEALFVAIKDDLATAICTTLLDADMEVLSVVVAPTAMYNAAKANMFGEETCDMILDLGGRGSNLIIMDGNRMFVRSIPIGGHTITQQIAKEFSIGFDDAEEMKRKHGFVALGGAYEDSDSEVAATISKIARNVMTRLHGEVNRSINAWRSMHGGNRPEALFITGGSSIIPYVPHFLNEKLGLEVSFLNTFPVVNISETIDKQQLLEIAHLFPPMVGLAIRHIRTCPVEIALIPKIIRTTRDLQQKKPYFYMSAICALLCLLVFFGGVSARTQYDKRLEALAKGELDSKKEIADRIKKQMRNLNEIQDQYNGLMDLAKARTGWMDVLNELQKYTPSNMWFTQIDGIKEYKLESDNKNQDGMMPGMDPGMMDPGMMPPGAVGPMPGAGAPMAPGVPGAPGAPMDPGMMDPGMMDPMMMDMYGPPPVPNEVAWLRLKGHSLVMDGQSHVGVEDKFKENLKNSELFDMSDPANFKSPALTVTMGKNNITSFVIYVKLKNTIKQ